MRDLDFHAVGIPSIRRPIAALLHFIPRDGVEGSRREGEVMIHELTPGDEEDRGRVVMVTFIRVDRSGDNAGRGEG